MNRLLTVFLIAFAPSVALPIAMERLSAEEPKAKPTEGPHESLDVRYARAYLQLAQANLQIDLEMNEKLRGTVPAVAIEPLKQIVAIAEAELKYAFDEDAHGMHTIHILHAEITVKRAEVDLQRTQAINRRSPETVDPKKLRRARLRLEVAKLALAKARAVDPENPWQHTQWLLEELRKEQLQLRSQLERLTLLRGG